MIAYFFKGLVIGLSIAAPVGPIGVLCIRRTLTQGRLIGLVSGLGAASADAVYGFIAAFGLTVISSFLIGQQFWLHLIGGIFLCYLGLKTFRSVAVEIPAKAEGKSLFSAYVSVFFLTITNPMTILAFLAIFAGLGLSASDYTMNGAIVLVLGVFIGSVMWWFLLSSVVGLFRERMTTKGLTVVNRVSGIIILIFGAFSLYGLLE